MATLRERVEADLARRRNTEIRDTTGKATGKLARSLRVPPTELVRVLKKMENEGAIVRDMAATRTFGIRLVTLEAEPIPVASANGAVAEQKRTDFLAKFNEAVGAGEAVVDALVIEIEQLRKQLAKSEQKVGELQLEVAALKREATDTRNSAQLIFEIEQKLAELKNG